jgi:phage tail tube protein FII
VLFEKETMGLMSLEAEIHNEAARRQALKKLTVLGDCAKGRLAAQDWLIKSQSQAQQAQEFVVRLAQESVLDPA